MNDRIELTLWSKLGYVEGLRDPSVDIATDHLRHLLEVVEAATLISDECGPSEEPYEADNVCPEWALETLRDALAKLKEATDA